jgi:hypothetical protein
MQKAINIYAMGEQPKERTYWLNRPAKERFQALEQLRQSFYDIASEGFQRVYRVIDLNQPNQGKKGQQQNKGPCRYRRTHLISQDNIFSKKIISKLDSPS